MRRGSLLLFLMVIACETRLCRDPNVWVPVEYVARRAVEAPVIDGLPDDAPWRKATWSEPFRLSNVPGRPRQRTRAKLLWDDAHLYVAFAVEDDDIRTPFTRHDEPLYRSEVVEIFIDAEGRGGAYDEIQLSPANVLFDARFTGRRKGMDLSWSSNARHAVKLDGTLNDASDVDRGWTAELAIPFSSLSEVPHLPPRPGDRWRFNLYRLDHGEGGVQGQAFCPVLVGDFHALHRFGWLRFAP